MYLLQQGGHAEADVPMPVYPYVLLCVVVCAVCCCAFSCAGCAGADLKASFFVGDADGVGQAHSDSDK